MSKADLKLDWCSHEAAKYAVTHWHYSRTMPKSKLAKVGVWEDSKFIGVVLFGLGATSNLVRPYGLQMKEGCELVRVALNYHKSPTSRIVAIAVRFLKRSMPGIRLIVSFADLNQQHLGVIYQAGNWIYSGMASDQGGSVIVHGVQMHGRSAVDKWGTRSIEWLRNNIDPNAKAAFTLGKHRYLMPLDAEMRAQILPLAKPYPKRAGSADSGTSGFQPEGGGATPTPALTE